MKTQITLAAAIGKPLTDYVKSTRDDRMILIFGDHYVCLGIRPKYEYGDFEGVEEFPLQKFGLDGFGDASLIEAGIITEAELEAIRAERTANRARHQLAAEKAIYERLREKFEIKSTPES
jgi:hypothetical protein